MKKRIFIVILITRSSTMTEYFEKLSSHFCLKRLLNILKLTWLKAKKLFLAMTQLLKRSVNTSWTFSEYFPVLVYLNIPNHGHKCPDSLEPNPILRIIDKYRDHPSRKLIKPKNNSRVFNFTQINIEEIKISHQNIDPEKVWQKDDTKINLLRKVPMWCFKSFFKISKSIKLCRHCTKS